MMRDAERQVIKRRSHRLGAAVAFLCLLPALLSGQVLDRQIDILGGQYRLQRPGAIAVANSGDQFAICDASADRIFVIDLDARILWTAGGQMHLGSPAAVCFDPANNVLFVPESQPLVLRVAERDPGVVDTVADLSAILPPNSRVNQLLPSRKGGYLLLSTAEGLIRRLDSAFQPTGKPIPTGSGKGKVLVPTSITEFDDGRLIVSDRKNYAVQCFSSDGAFLFFGGWNEGGAQRGWGATATAIDSRGIIWVADETESRFRLFDQAGTQVAEIAFPSPVFRPVSMTATSDNRIMVLDESGTLVFYDLE